MTIKITLKGEQKTIPELTDEEIELMLDVCKDQYCISKDDKLFEVYDELIREQYRRKLGIQDTVAKILKATSMSMKNK